jgi:hypothetical protein
MAIRFYWPKEAALSGKWIAANLERAPSEIPGPLNDLNIFDMCKGLNEGSQG